MLRNDAILLAAFPLLALPTMGWGAIPIHEFLSATPCVTEESKVLGKWGVDSNGQPIEPNPSGKPLSVLAPTREIGTWVILKRDAQGIWMSAKKISPGQSSEL